MLSPPPLLLSLRSPRSVAYLRNLGLGEGLEEWNGREEGGIELIVGHHLAHHLREGRHRIVQVVHPPLLLLSATSSPSRGTTFCQPTGFPCQRAQLLSHPTLLG